MENRIQFLFLRDWASGNLSAFPATFPGIPNQYQTDASGSLELQLADRCSSLFFSFPVYIIQEPHLPVENGGSSVSCQPEAILFLFDSIDAHYLLFCLAEYNVETLRCYRESAKS